jgi:hypothetical protein
VATISSLLADHVTPQVRSVNRFPIPSPAVLGKMGREYVRSVDHGHAGTITRGHSTGVSANADFAGAEYVMRRALEPT